MVHLFYHDKKTPDWFTKYLGNIIYVLLRTELYVVEYRVE